MPVCEQDFEDGVLKQTRIHLLGARGIEGIITVPSTSAASLTWLFYDGHGNMVRTMNTSFALSGFHWRGVWGERTTSNAGRGYCANLGHPEDETGLVYMRARYYEPGAGRFVSEDLARDGVNWYLYADADPVGKVDANGKESEWEWCIPGSMLTGFAILYALLGIEVAKNLGMPDFAFLPSGLAVCFLAGALYCFFRALGGFSSEWIAVIGTIGGILINPLYHALSKTLDEMGKLGRVAGGIGLVAALAAGTYAGLVTAALLLSYVVSEAGG